MSNIAVLLASFNGEKYLKEQITSILNQKEAAVEIFLRDDHSDDDTVKIARTLIPGNHITVNKVSTGSAANNFFLSVLNFRFPENYDYFAFSDQDDIWLPEKLSKAITNLKHSNASLYSSNLLIWDTKTNSKKVLKKDFSQKKYDFLFEGGSAGCTYVFTREFFLLLREKLRNTNYLDWPDFSHDWFAYFIARSSKMKVINSSDAEILYRIHETNVHGQLHVFSVNTIIKRIQMVRNGWYLNNSLNYAKCLEPESEEFEIYRLYCENMGTRLKLLFKYNFNLMRNPKKFFVFGVVSIFFTGYVNKNTFGSVFIKKN